MTIAPASRLVLASASPRRAELLERAAIDVVVDPASVDESVLAGESAPAYATRVAEAKARLDAEMKKLPKTPVKGRLTVVLEKAVSLDLENGATEAVKATG